ncbi:MAG: hypothetical protein PHS92_05080 [Candidatus Gracilibacteria bacterium]|nr:hypothetical protein [Candidatus Gracilibacteria bacterium]
MKKSRSISFIVIIIILIGIYSYFFIKNNSGRNDENKGNDIIYNVNFYKNKKCLEDFCTSVNLEKTFKEKLDIDVHIENKMIFDNSDLDPFFKKNDFFTKKGELGVLYFDESLNNKIYKKYKTLDNRITKIGTSYYIDLYKFFK